MSYGWSVPPYAAAFTSFSRRRPSSISPRWISDDRAALPAAQLEPHVAVLVADPLCRPAELPRSLVVVGLHRIEAPLEREIAVRDPLGLALE